MDTFKETLISKIREIIKASGILGSNNPYSYTYFKFIFYYNVENNANNFKVTLWLKNNITEDVISIPFTFIVNFSNYTLGVKYFNKNLLTDPSSFDNEDYLSSIDLDKNIDLNSFRQALYDVLKDFKL